MVLFYINKFVITSCKNLSRKLQIFYEGKLRYEVFDIKLGCGTGGGRTYTKDDMEAALDALRERSLSLTRASEKFGIPPTTLWQVNIPNIQMFHFDLIV